MNTARSEATLFLGQVEITRTLLVEYQTRPEGVVISNVHLEDDEGGTVEITGTLSLDQLTNIAEDLGIKGSA